MSEAIASGALRLTESIGTSGASGLGAAGSRLMTTASCPRRRSSAATRIEWSPMPQVAG
jgi:hypothetical protein